MTSDTDGMNEALSTTQALSQTMSDLEARSQRFGTALSSALKSAVVDGKGLESVLTSLATRLSDIALSAALKPLESSISSAASGLFSSIGSVTPFADGGVVRSPSFFSMGGSNMGLMGEAGAEAILPLQRGPDGALGVAVSGGGGGSAQVVFNVNATDAASFRKSEGQISAMLARSVARGRRGM